MLVGALILEGLAFIPAILADLNGLLQALNTSCLDQLANATASLNGTNTGRVVLAQLSHGNNTIFAPTDNALSSVDPATIDNQTVLADVISYHIVQGNFINQTRTYPDVTIGHTLLNNSALVTLEGNQSQVLLWSKYDNGSLFLHNQGSNITVVNMTTYGDTVILTIDSVLAIPPNLSTILSNPSYDLTAVGAFLNSTSFLNGPSFLDTLMAAHGITLFAPDNAGVEAAQSCLAGLSNNKTALLDVLSNHIINGSSVYSTDITTNTTLTSAGGQNYAFTSNSTGCFISVGGSNQVQLLRTDLLTSNGVIHIIDDVMVDTSVDPAAASSAFASATSVAASESATATVTLSPSSSGGVEKGGTNNWKWGVLAGVIVGFGQCM